MVVIETATATDIGHRETNQDRVLAITGDTTDMPCGLFCVADGMGGLQDGECAATQAVELLENWWNSTYKETTPTGAEVLDSFFTLFKSVNDAIKHNTEEAKSGTTCSLLLIQGRDYYIAHAGDSRIYHIENRIFAPFAMPVQLTEDHSHNGRLTSCLGAFNKPKIFTHTGTISKPCTFVLCSDGMYRTVPDKQLIGLTRRLRNCGELVNNLVTTALKQGTQDNVSVVVVKVGG